MAKKSYTLTDPSCYTFYDRKNEVCWIMQPSISEQGHSNTGLSPKTLEYLRQSLNKWKDDGVETFIINDQPLGDYMLGENLTEFTEKSIAFAVRLDLDRSEKFAFRDNPCGYLFDVNDDLCDDVEVVGTMSYSPCSNKGNYTIDYSVVNEKFRGKGIGTAMLRSFIENPDFFTYNRHLNTVFASVRDDNARCKKTLKQLGFVCQPNYGRLGQNSGKHYSTYKKVLEDEREYY